MSFLVPSLWNLPKNPNNTGGFARGEAFQQLFDAYPSLRPFYFDYEVDYDPEPLLEVMVANKWALPVTSVVIYLLMCYFGTKIMKNKKAFDLVTPLAAWNLFLSLFSAYGMIRSVPHLFWIISTKTFEETVCDPAHTLFGGGAVGLATQLFCLSKIPELIDTVFIVLRKKPLIFLHWYHHVTVLLYCWNSYVTESAAGIYFIAMNYTVHAVMYFYYFLQAMKALPKSFPSWIITSMQISQMFVGTSVVLATMYYYKYGGTKFGPGKCNNSEANLVAGGLMYGSYLYLFCEFAVKRFIFGVRELPSDKPKKATKKVE